MSLGHPPDGLRYGCALKAADSASAISFALRVGFHALPVFLHDHVALLVEIAEDRMHQALRFHQKPEFGAVGRETVGILGGGGGSQAVRFDCAVFFQDAPILAGRGKALCVVGRQAVLIAQHVHAHLVGLDTFVGFRLHAVVGFFNSVQRFLFLGPVAGADGFRALECHMLEHMGQAGLARRDPDAARIHEGMEGNHGRLVPFEHDEMQPVGQGELGYLLLQLLKSCADTDQARE